MFIMRGMRVSTDCVMILILLCVMFHFSGAGKAYTLEFLKSVIPYEQHEEISKPEDKNQMLVVGGGKVEIGDQTLTTKYPDGTIEYAFYRGEEVKTGVYTKLDKSLLLSEIGRYRDGRKHGLRWKRAAYHSWILSNANSGSLIQINRIFELSVVSTIEKVGDFDENCMAFSDLEVAEIVGAVSNQAILIPSLRQCGMKIPCPLTDMSETVTNQHCYRDPYEHRTIEVRESLIPEAGEGLFTIRSVMAGQLLAYFAGVKVKDKNGKQSDYAITLKDGQIIDIPTEIRTTYCATLGHKACHSFQPSAYYGYTTHPRFGEIRCVIALHNLEPGQEITTDYRYGIGKAPEWYINCLKDFLISKRGYGQEEAELYVTEIIAKAQTEKDKCINENICYRD